MLTEKPSWVRHEGLQIFSIDIQPSGLRFATGGGDQKVGFCLSSDFFTVPFEFQPLQFQVGCAKIRYFFQH
jgi:hypothetical protein